MLLIDAGDDQGSALQQQVPAMNLMASEYPPMRWDFFVNHYQNQTRQEQDSKFTWQTPSGNFYVGAGAPAGSKPLGILYPRSGTLGGCTAHNALITVYPDDSDWQQIATITGDNSWNPTNMRTYFERLEMNEYLPSSVVGHGYGGWLQTSLTSLGLVVEDQTLLSLVISACTAAGKSLLGLALNTVTGLAGALGRDMNSPTRGTSTGPYQVPISVSVPSETRSGARGFILNTMNTVKNGSLELQLNTLVTKVLFNTTGSTPVATGVQYLEGQSLYGADPRSVNASAGTPGSVTARKEVILSAGTFNTPQLLKLSGIGPQAELQKWNIPVLVNSPGVGTNMQDRYENTIVGESNTNFTITEDCTFMMSMPDPCLTDWQNSPTTATYATNGIAVGVLQKSSTSNTAAPDLFISGAPANFRGYFPGYADAALSDAKHWAWISLKSHTRNTAGAVTLRSANPQDTPVINFNYFDTGTTAGNADQLDLQAQYEGLMFGRKAFADLVPLSGTFTEVWPGPNVTTEAQMKDYIMQEAWGHHACCTNPIGADNNPNAVLDSEFRVRGVHNLRVVDASAFPYIPGYYLVLPTYMISEKAADVILAAANSTSTTNPPPTTTGAQTTTTTTTTGGGIGIGPITLTLR